MDLLQRFLSKSGLSQSEFGRRAGIPQSLICHYVHGKRVPKLVNAIAIERATSGAVPVKAWAPGPRRGRHRQRS